MYGASRVPPRRRAPSMQVAASASAVVEGASSIAKLAQKMLSKHPSAAARRKDAAGSAAAEACTWQEPVFSSLGLQLWILLASQEPMGLRDKPGKPPDWYHTCYCLSGLSVAQAASGTVLGGLGNAVCLTDALTNTLPARLAAARKHWSRSQIH
jgi:hypothetical protein